MNPDSSELGRRRSLRKKFKCDPNEGSLVNGTSTSKMIDDQTQNLKNETLEIKTEKIEETIGNVVNSQAGAVSGYEEILEMPAFSVEDLHCFENEDDTYAVYALTFACFERNVARMRRVVDRINLEESKITGRYAGNKKATKENGQHVLNNLSSPDSVNNEKVCELLADKLRTLLGYFVPKTYKLNPDKIYEMSYTELINVNLPELEKACEGEFSRLIEERKKTLRERYEAQVTRMKSAVIQFAKKHDPDLQLDDNMQMNDILQALTRS